MHASTCFYDYEGKTERCFYYMLKKCTTYLHCFPAALKGVNYFNDADVWCNGASDPQLVALLIIFSLKKLLSPFNRDWSSLFITLSFLYLSISRPCVRDMTWCKSNLSHTCWINFSLLDTRSSVSYRNCDMTFNSNFSPPLNSSLYLAT